MVRLRRKSSFSRFSPGRDLRSLYGRHFREPRKERRLFSIAGFFTTFAATRAITHSIRAGKGPFGNISSGGREIHHMTFGIVGLLLVGYLWMLEIGVRRGSSRASRLTSLCYGAGAALTLDEFALWLDLEDEYWAKEGRKSIDAVLLFGSLLALSAVGRDLLREVLETVGMGPRMKAIRRAQRYVLHHPQGALRSLTEAR